jgi:drug/metabolite transporter (DMT)-like permease
MLIKYVPWSSWAVAGWRSFFTTVFLWLAFRTLYPKEWRLDFSPGNLLIAVLYSAFTTLFAISGKLTTSANTVLLQYTSPIYIAILAPYIIGERTRGRDYLLILMTLGGMVLLLLSPGQERASEGEPLGLAAGAACGFCWGMCVMLMRRQGMERIPLSCLVIGNAITVVYCLPAMVSVGPESIGSNLFFSAVLGIGPLGLGYVFYLAALGRVTALEASLIPSIEPLLNPVWTFMVIGEVPGFWTFVGGAVVLLAVTLKALSAWRSPAPASAPQTG